MSTSVKYARFIGGLVKGKNVTIGGKVPSKLDSFSVDFCVGAGEKPDIGLHIKADMATSNINSSKPFPFAENKKIEIKVYSQEENQASIDINGDRFLDYKITTQLPGSTVDFLRIEGLNNITVTGSLHDATSEDPAAS